MKRVIHIIAANHVQNKAWRKLENAAMENTSNDWENKHIKYGLYANASKMGTSSKNSFLIA